MRTRVLCWSLGLLSVSWLSGCGLFGSANTEHCQNCGAPAGAGMLPKHVKAKPKKYGEPPIMIAYEQGPPVRKFSPSPNVRIAAQTHPITGSHSQPFAGLQSQPIAGLQSQPITGMPETESTILLPEIKSLPLPVVTKKVEPAPFTVDHVPTTQLQESVARQNERVEAANAPTAEQTSLKEQSVSIKTVHIQYGHTETFDSVTGQVQAFRKTWRLRYAAISQEDQYGGFVMLEGGSELNQVRDGQHVRVKGVLIPPTDRTLPARYRVTTIEILD